MNIIKSQDIKNAIKTLTENHNGTVWQALENTESGKTLCLVYGYAEGYDKGEKYQVIENGKTYTLCAKLAFNIDDLQCDYDVDWYMPYNENGDVYDTDSAITDDYQALADYYNKEAKIIIDLMNKGELVIE